MEDVDVNVLVSRRAATQPFIDGLRIAFTFSRLGFLAAAGASWMRGPVDAPPSPGGQDEGVTEAMEEAALT